MEPFDLENKLLQIRGYVEVLTCSAVDANEGVTSKKLREGIAWLGMHIGNELDAVFGHITSPSFKASASGDGLAVDADCVEVEQGG